MKNILQIAAVVLVASVIGGVVAGLVGNQSATLGASGTRFPNGISADSTSPSAGEVRGTTLVTTGAITFGGDISSTEATGTSTLDLLGARSCIEMVASNGSTTAFYATSSTSGLVQISSCN